MDRLLARRSRPGDGGPADPLAGWSQEQVDEAFRALVATLTRLPPPAPAVPARPAARVGDQDANRRPPCRQRSPPR
ncbi:hypothetical protein [Kineococcus sp. SYSU DK001]|uniref:hypothetical protein n=1 Tax=Kineococcus sp. SYSU DK001 TaxID=3383122 RepID=UPI003D7D80FB